MNFGIEIYGDGDRKPWEKKERENWARGLGGGGLCTMGVRIYIYISSLWVHLFLPRILPFVEIASFPQKIN